MYLDGQADQADFVAEAAEQLEQTAADKQVEYWSFPQMYEKHQAVFEQYFIERLERLQQRLTNIECVLDVGCGFGFFMKYLVDQGIVVEGIDIEAKSVAYARDELGLKVDQVSFEAFSGRGPYDAIVACDVLEHVADPPGFLLKCRELLRAGGMLYLQVPNVVGDVLPADGSYNWPYHLWQFSPETLRRLLEQNGFAVCDWWTGVMGVVGVYEQGGPDEQTQAMWRTAVQQRRGNRLQMLAQPR